MDRVLDRAVGAFRAAFTGRVITVADPDYDRARYVWTGANKRRPSHRRVRAGGRCEVIAEGSASREQADERRELGVRLGQGFLYARPARPPELLQDPLLRDRQPVPTSR